LLTAGSTVEFLVQFNKPLDVDVPLRIEPVDETAAEEALSFQGASNSNEVRTTKFVADKSRRFHVFARDTDGFSNAGLEEFELIVRPDQAPMVQIELPRRSEERTGVAVIPMKGLAEDDFAVRTLQLQVVRLGDKKKWTFDLVNDGTPAADVSWEPADGSGDRKQFRGAWSWDLSKLADANLKSGDVLEYCLSVEDNFLLNGEVHPRVLSSALRITIVSPQELADRLTEELRNASSEVQEIKNNQLRTQQEAQSLGTDTKDQPKLGGADKQVTNRLANQQSTSASQSRQVAGKVGELKDRMEENKLDSPELKDIARDVRDILTRAAEGPMKAAANDLNDAQQKSDDQARRNESIAAAVEKQKSGDQQLQSALDRMGSIGSLAKTVADIKALLEEQQKLTASIGEVTKANVGKKPEDMPASDREKLEALAREQKALSDKTDKAIQGMQKASTQMSKADPQAADALSQAAKSGQSQQVSQNQSKAAESARQNQQSSTQSSQKQAELGLETMLAKLREAERHKLEELSKKLQDLQEQIATLIRRQAGHNLDNLSLQGPDRLMQLAAEEKTNLMTLADRDANVPPPAIKVTQLSSAQEQTERNTRDLINTAEKLPNGAEPASNLTRAAGRMERAIVSLRDAKLTDAYDPPQVEALAALLEAKRLVDEQKEKADEKIKEQQQESIRAAYVRIRAEQQKVNVETLRIEGLRNPTDQSLKRVEAVRLGQLPGEEGKLADQIRKVGENLSALGSVVYVWANTDIAKAMDGVKNNLGGGITSSPTQLEQKRIVAQLDAMIRNLALKPQEKKFEKSAGGGGGQGGKSAARLPSEAELRLLRDLQVAVNDETKVVDASPDKDLARLDALGGTQGELRSVLDQLIQSASGGQMKLPAEPDPSDTLPEEAKAEDIENQELDQDLLAGGDAEKMEKDVDLIGDRMARSKQRLAANDDPGKITQVIQERILINLDALIDEARKQQSQSASSASQSKGQPKPKPQANAGQPKNQGEGKNGKPQQATKGNSPGQQAGNLATGTPGNSEDIRQKLSEWGALSERERQAIREGAGEVVIEKYKGLIDDYYRTLAERSSQSR